MRWSVHTCALPAASCLALAPFEVIIEVVDFFEDLVVVGEALLLNEVVRTLALVNQRHHTRNSRSRELDNVLGAILLQLLAVMNHGLDRVDLVRCHRLHIQVAFSRVGVLADVMVDIHLIVVYTAAVLAAHEVGVSGD